MYYVDMQIMPTNGISDSILMSELMQKLHPYFVKTNGVIGVSFPLISKTGLGTTLRLQSKVENVLRSVPEVDFVMIGDVAVVPDATPIRVKRKQFKSNVNQLARRYAKRHNVSLEDAIKRYSSFNEQRTALPYLMIKSASSKQQFRLFVESEYVVNPVNGIYSSYGLSVDGSTVMSF